MGNGELTIKVQAWIGQLASDDAAVRHDAKTQLISLTRSRLEAICRRMFFSSLRSAPAVDWEDAFQEAVMKLLNALDVVQPQNPREYFGLASKKIRETLLDMCRKWVRDPVPFAVGSETSMSPVTAAKWEEFHRQVQLLKPKLCETFELLWYHELPQAEVAELLGVDVRTVKRYWQEARLAMADYAP